MTLALSATISFLSLTKTGFNVNVPDPDEKRRSPQNPENAKFFPLTSLLFHFVCVLFRVGSLAYFFATVRGWVVLKGQKGLFVSFKQIRHDSFIKVTQKLWSIFTNVLTVTHSTPTFYSYTAIVILASFGINVALLAREGASVNVTVLLGAVSIFMPNGYLLYNFAATFPVDFSFDSTKWELTRRT